MSTISKKECYQESYVCLDTQTAYQQKSFSAKVQDWAVTFFKEIIFMIKMIPGLLEYIFCRSQSYCEIPSNPSAPEIKVPFDYGWKNQSEGLYVFISGLKSHPIWANSYIRAVETNQPNVDIRVPFVHKSGNCSLEDASAPFIRMIKDYIENNPGKPIHLIGTSNGGRIAGYVESSLRNIKANIRVSSIAGVFFGSTHMDCLAKTCPWCTSLIYAPEIIQDLQIASETSKKLIEAMRKPLESDVGRDFEFYATMNDEFIGNEFSSLPFIEQRENHYILEREGHFSIIDRVKNDLLQRSYQWMEQNR